MFDAINEKQLRSIAERIKEAFPQESTQLSKLADEWHTLDDKRRGSLFAASAAISAPPWSRGFSFMVPLGDEDLLNPSRK